MRRKSARNASKASPEKSTETATRRSRRHSKRHKRSSSRSSSEGSDDVSLKTVAEQITEVPAEDIPKIQLPGEEGTEQPVWKVTPSAAPSGEIQKLKICLTRPAPASPDKTEPAGKRRRNKSGSQLDEDVTSSEEKMPRRSRYRGSPGVNVEEQEEQIEETEEKKGKGKSKTKHKSKSEKAPQIQDVQDQTQSEISENVQVTPQSPQAAIDIRVDNECVSAIEHETVSIHGTETNSVPQSANASELCDVISENSENTVEEISVKHGDANVTTTHSPPIKATTESTKPHNDSANLQLEPGFKGFDMSTQSTTSQEEQTESVIEEKEPVQEEIKPAKIEEQGTKCKTPEQEMVVDQNVEEVAVQSQDDRSCEEQKVDQEMASPSKSENLEKMDVESEVQAQTKNEEIPISEGKKEQESMVDDEHESEQHQSEEDHAVEVPSESLQKEESHETPIHCESKTESCSSEELENVDEKDAHEKTQNLSSFSFNKDESNTKSVAIEELQRSDDDSRSADVIIIDSSSTPKKEDASFNLTQSFSPDVQDIVEANKELQSMAHEMAELFQTPPKRHKQKWGNSLAGLELITPCLYKIDINTVKQFCPDLQFLKENELKMEVREVRDRRKSLSDQKEKRSDRKVSIEHQANVADPKRLETESSVSLSVMEEVNEPEVDNSNIIAMNRKISIVEDTASKLKPPPSPAKNPISEVLFITNLVRPFTLKQLKELLERTGKIRENGFWTDRIKSKCYVYYETTEEAEATRNALHGVHWPIGNGKKLIIDYATAEDLERARNPAPPTPPVILEQKIPEQENQVPPKKHKPEEPEKIVKERERHKSETHVREWDIGKEDLHRLRSRSRDREGRNEKNERRRHRHSTSPVDDFISRKQRKKEEDIPQKLMDDLFRKTKTTPSIYWLPLTPEEIATKQQQRLLRMAEHKRRMEESSRSRGDYGRGAPYRRRYD